MSITAIRGKQVLDGSIQRADLDVSTVGQAVVAKLVQGSNVTLSSTGADSGTGDVTISAANQAVSGDANNLLSIGSDSLHYLPPSAIQPTIWSVRLRSFNALGASNPTLEVDQRNGGATVANASGLIVDRWAVFKQGTMAVSAGQNSAAATDVVVPGTNFFITKKFFRVTLTTAQASLGATDLLQVYSSVEGPQLRELLGDVHSIQVLVRSSVAGLKFGVTLADSGPQTKVFSHLCTIGSANTWQLFTIPNTGVFASGGSWTVNPGAVGYNFLICLAAGSSSTVSANDAWVSLSSGSGAVGQSNFAASAVNSTFDIAFCQHEPGALCTTPQDKNFSQNYDECLRYYQKSYSYGTIAATATVTGVKTWLTTGAATTGYGNAFFHKPMAKIPTVTFYSHATGAANNVREANGTEHGSAAALALNETGFYGVSFTTNTAGATNLWGHYTADTGF